MFFSLLFPILIFTFLKITTAYNDKLKSVHMFLQLFQRELYDTVSDSSL